MAATLFAGAETAAEIAIFPGPIDKGAHFIYYALMAVLLSHGVGMRWLWVPIVLVPLVGALDEWHQMSIVGRDASIGDFAADVVGAILATGVYWWKRKGRDESDGVTGEKP